MLTTRVWVLPVFLGLYAATTPLHALPLSDEKLDASSTATSANSTSEVCLYEGVVYAKGEKTAKPGPCEECVCQPPSVVCSMTKCPVQSGCRIIQRGNQCCPDYKCECEYNSQIYNNGERLDTRDEPCKVCYCKGGEVMCTSISCYHRDDCEPRFVAGQCCPKYDHCPLKDINPLDEKDDTSSANNRSYVYSPKREMQPWLLTKSVEVKVAPTAPTQVMLKSTENTASSTFETTTRSNDEQQQTWNNIIVSDWLTERRTTTAEDDSTRITAYENTENNLNTKYSPTTENSVSTDSNTDFIATDQENRTKTMDTTSDTTSAETLTEIISEHVTETGTELNTVTTETPYTDKLVTIVFKETSLNGFTTIASDIIYNDERHTEMPPLRFLTVNNADDLNIPFTNKESQNSEENIEENDEVHSVYELTNEVKRYVSTEPSLIETSSTLPEENNTVLFAENGTGITSTDYEVTTEVDVVLTEANETKTEPEDDKSGNSRTKNNASLSPEELVLTTQYSVGPNDLVTQSIFSAEIEHLNENNENQMLKDTSLVNLENDKDVYSNNERNVATVDNDHQNSYSKESDTTTEVITLNLMNGDEHSTKTQNLQPNLLDSQRERENETISVSNNGSITEIIGNPESLNQTPNEEHGIEKTIKPSELQENQQSDNHGVNVHHEISEIDSGDAEEIGTEVNSFETHSDDGNKNTDDYSYEPPVLELNSQLPFLQIGGHGSMEILSTDGSEENGTPEIENVEFSVEEQHVNNTTTEDGYKEPISSSTHIPLTPGDLKILAEYLINEKIKPTKNESSTYMPTEWLKGNLTSNTTKIASILSAANISIGIINRNKSDSIVKLTEGNLDNKTLLQENVTTQTLENLLSNKDSVTEKANYGKDKNNGVEEPDDTVNTEGTEVIEILSTTSYYTPNKDNSFVDNLNESNQIQHVLNKSVEDGESVTEITNSKDKNNGVKESDDTAVSLVSSLDVTNTDINETVNTESIEVTEISFTTPYYTPNKDSSFVENLKRSNQMQHVLNKTVEDEEPKEMIEVDRIAENKTENNENFNAISEDMNKKNLSLLTHTNSDGDKLLPSSENSSTKTNEVDSSSSGNIIKQDNKELYENVFYPEDKSYNNTNTLKNLSNHKKRINPGESDEYTSRKVRIPEMESIVKEPFSASLDDNDLTILKEFLIKHMIIP